MKKYTHFKVVKKNQKWYLAWLFPNTVHVTCISRTKTYNKKVTVGKVYFLRLRDVTFTNEVDTKAFYLVKLKGA